MLILQISSTGPQDAKVRFENFELTPLPLKFGQDGNLAVLLKVREPIHGGFSDLAISRVFNAFGFEVPLSLPCIDGYGACVSDLGFTLKDSDLICGLLRSANTTCGLPLHRGTIGTESYQFPVPAMNGIFSLFASVSDKLIDSFISIKHYFCTGFVPHEMELAGHG